MSGIVWHTVKGFAGRIKSIGRLHKLPRVGIAAVHGGVAWTSVACNLNPLVGVGEWWEPSRR